MVGADHRVLLPCSFLVGAAFLAVCDAVARVVLAPADLPVGVITAILGGPFFIWLLRTRRQGVAMSIILIGGGARSGKSRYALSLARQSGGRLAFIATARAERR